MTCQWHVRPRHRSARRRANPVIPTKKEQKGFTSFASFFIYKTGFEGRVLNDSPGSNK